MVHHSAAKQKKITTLIFQSFSVLWDGLMEDGSLNLP
jgi:hypothetical protein